MCRRAETDAKRYIVNMKRRAGKMGARWVVTVRGSKVEKRVSRGVVGCG